MSEYPRFSDFPEDHERRNRLDENGRMMDHETRLQILKEAREMVMNVRRDVAEDRDSPQKALIHLRMVTNELHRARVELGMYEKHGVAGWKATAGAEEAWRKRESDR